VKLKPGERPVVHFEVRGGTGRRVARSRPLGGGIELPVRGLHRLRIVREKWWTGPSLAAEEDREKRGYADKHCGGRSASFD
jgi:hypothetical protein